MTALSRNAPRAVSVGIIACVTVACNGDSAPTAATPTEGKLAVELRNFVYLPKDVSIKSGVPVTLSLISRDIDHTFTVNDLGIDRLVKGGAVYSETFTFSKTGTFKIICTVPGHEGAGMTGSIIVH